MGLSGRVRHHSVVAAVCLGLASSCAGTGFRYVRDGDTDTYFKVPESWTVFQREELFPAFPRSAGFRDTGNPVAYVAAFTNDPGAGPDAIPSELAEQPQGYVIVQELQELADRDATSFRTLRNEVYPIDQMLSEDPGSVQIFSYDDEFVQDGFRGVKMVFSVRSSPDPVRAYTDSFTVNQTVLVDPATTMRYTFVLMCTSSCYGDHETEIQQIVDSFRVKEPS
jgi:hypothetical protein